MRIKQQRGMTFFGGIIALSFVAYVLYSAVRMVFIHMDHLKIVSSMEALSSVSRDTEVSESKIRRMLRTNLGNNGFYNEDLDKYTKGFKIVFEEGKLKVSIKYNITYYLIFGYSITKHYEEKYEDKRSIVVN